MTNFCETRVVNLEPKQEKKNASAAAKKFFKKIKKRKRQDSDSSVIESSEGSTENRSPSKKYCILHAKCSHFIDSCKDLCSMVNKHKEKEKKFQDLLKKQQGIGYSN